MADEDAKAAWIARVLGVSPSTTATTSAQDGPLVAYRKLLLQWDQAKKAAGSQIGDLQAAVVREFPDLAGAAKRLDEVMGRFNEGLGDALDDAMSADNPAQRERHRNRAADIARRYFVMVNTHPLFRHVDENPVTPLTLRATLGGTLKSLLGALPA